MRSLSRTTGMLLAISCGVACEPSFADRLSSVDRPMVLAVQAEPPEAKPGELVAYRLLVATPQGPVETPAADWAYCLASKPLADNNAVATACLNDQQVQPIASAAATASAPLPIDACQNFGSDVRAGTSSRPRDADGTGGFYQPLRVDLSLPDADPLTAFGLPRILCNLGNAPVSIATQYAMQYTPNRNPTLSPLQASINGTAVPLEIIPADAIVRLRAEWPPEAVETFVVYNRSTTALAEQREIMQVSWFTTAGSFAADRSGRGSSDVETFSDNDWTAPSEAGRVFLWLVLRDSRGGLTSAAYTVEVVTP